MRIAVTGGSGKVGCAVLKRGLELGHDLVNIDRKAPEPGSPVEGVRFVKLEMSDYDGLAAALEGYEALIHLAAIPSPDPRLPDHVVHNTNVVGSYNALRAAVGVGMTRICQASSVNAIGHEYSP